MEENLNSLEMGKKRNHKIIITDEAIRKVPYIRYKEIPDENYELIQSMARQVLQISKEDNNSNEVAITFSMDDEFLMESRDDFYGVAIGDEHSADPLTDTFSSHLILMARSCAVVSLHNHPSASKISLPDIRFFLTYPSIKLLVVVTNLGSISYLVKGKKYSHGDAVKLFNESVTIHNEATDLKGLQDAAGYYLKKCYLVGVIYEDR